VLEELSNPEGKWLKSQNERSQSQFTDVYMVLGFSCHPQPLLNYEKTLVDRQEDRSTKTTFV